MKYQETNGESIEQAFERFDRDNPEVYRLFRQLTFRAINAGKKKTSSKMIVNVLRWEFYLKTVGDEFKINDAFTAHYARKFINDFPEFNHIFELRRLRS